MPDSSNFGRRKGDTMPGDNDHDLLVRLDTKVTLLIEQQVNFIRTSNDTSKELSERIARLEVKDSKDSGKFESISADVQRSLANHDKIIALEKTVNNLEKELDGLRKKANLFDYINATGVVISGVIGTIFGSR